MVSKVLSSSSPRRRGSLPRNRHDPRVHVTSKGTGRLRRRGWLRHAATLAAVIGGAWYGVDTGSRGALLVADAGTFARLVWP